MILALTLVLEVEAQPVGTAYRIGFLGGASAPGYAALVEALRLGLRDHGYVEGKNITIEYRWAEGKYDRLPALAAELFRLMNPDNPAMVSMFRVMEERAQALNVKLRRVNVLPSIGFREYCEAGGLLAYGVDFPLIWRQSAVFVAKTLKGAKPADLPVEQPTKFELVINLKTAKALGLTIPSSLLLRADQVIE